MEREGATLLRHHPRLCAGRDKGQRCARQVSELHAPHQGTAQRRKTHRGQPAHFPLLHGLDLRCKGREVLHRGVQTYEPLLRPLRRHTERWQTVCASRDEDAHETLRLRRGEAQDPGHLPRTLRVQHQGTRRGQTGDGGQTRHPARCKGWCRHYQRG